MRDGLHGMQTSEGLEALFDASMRDRAAGAGSFVLSPADCAH
jgi:hypothetical protein